MSELDPPATDETVSDELLLVLDVVPDDLLEPPAALKCAMEPNDAADIII